MHPLGIWPIERREGERRMRRQRPWEQVSEWSSGSPSPASAPPPPHAHTHSGRKGCKFYVYICVSSGSRSFDKDPRVTSHHASKVTTHSAEPPRADAINFGLSTLHSIREKQLMNHGRRCVCACTSMCMYVCVCVHVYMCVIYVCARMCV